MQVRAHVGDVAQLQPRQRAVAPGGNLDIDDHVAALGGHLDVFAARGGPLHGPAELQGEVARQDVLGRCPGFGAEAAANVGRDHPHLVRFEPQDTRQIGSQAVRRLARCPHGESCARRVTRHSHDAAWLQRHGCDPRAVDAHLCDHVGFLEGPLDIAALFLQHEADVAVELRMHAWRVGRQGCLG